MLLAVIECLKDQLERNQEEGKKQNRSLHYMIFTCQHGCHEYFNS